MCNILEGTFESSAHERLKVEKLWGWEEWVVNEDKYCGKLLWIEGGYQCSLHYHPVKDETFMCIAGLVVVEYTPPGSAPQKTILRGWARDAVIIPHNTIHRFSTPSTGAVVVEFSTHHSDVDVVRLEESRRLEDHERVIEE